MSLEMAHKVILPPQKNYIPQFLKQRDINSYYLMSVQADYTMIHYFAWGFRGEFVGLKSTGS